MKAFSSPTDTINENLASIRNNFRKKLEKELERVTEDSGIVRFAIDPDHAKIVEPVIGDLKIAGWKVGRVNMPDGLVKFLVSPSDIPEKDDSSEECLLDSFKIENYRKTG